MQEEQRRMFADARARSLNASLASSPSLPSCDVLDPLPSAPPAQVPDTATVPTPGNNVGMSRGLHRDDERA
jgi:hypothetical protein